MERSEASAQQRSRSRIRSVEIPESGAKLGPAARHREAWGGSPPAESPGGETKAAACLARLPVNSNN